MAPRKTRCRDGRVQTAGGLYRDCSALTRMRRPAPADRPKLPLLLLVLDVPDDVGDVLVALLLLLDEGGVVHGLVLELALLLGALGRVALGGLLALGLGVGFLERDELGIRRLRRYHLLLRSHGPRRLLRTPARADRRQLHHRVALRADDRVLAE